MHAVALVCPLLVATTEPPDISPEAAESTAISGPPPVSTVPDDRAKGPAPRPHRAWNPPHPGLELREPMLFDLARPLDSAPGGYEVNAIVAATLHEIEWGPELEYTLDHGTSVEAEFPFIDENSQGAKVSVQQRVLLTEETEQGLLLTGQYGFGQAPSSATLTYIAEFALPADVSFAVIGGGRIVEIAEAGEETLPLAGDEAPSAGVRGLGILNPTLFYSFSEDYAWGVETDLLFDGGGLEEAIVLPQANLEFFGHVNVQAGCGLEHDAHARKTAALAALRLTVQL